MSILFAVPCYGAQVTAPFFRSCLDLKEVLTQVGIDHDFLLMWNESLIQRGRNNLCRSFLETGYRKLMFLDADLEFAPEDVAKLWNLDADVAVGLYPMKRKDRALGAWREGRLVGLADCPTEAFTVDYAGTGFFMIDRRVLERMRESNPDLVHREGEGLSYAWFNPRVESLGDDRVYLSEDYAFCLDARRLGFEVLAEPSIRMTHWGMHGYDDPRGAQDTA